MVHSDYELTVGYAAIIFSTVLFGSTYVPTKQHPTYDGIIFQWFMCSGIFFTGLVWGIYNNNWNNFEEAGLYVFPEGVIGGAMWAVANMMIPSIVNLIGLGLGFVFWNSTNLLVGYCVVREGWFGVKERQPDNDFLNLLGFGMMMASTVVFSFVQPKEASSRAFAERTGAEEETLMPILGQTPPTSSRAKLDIRRSLILSELPNFGPYELNSMANPYKEGSAGISIQARALGIFLAILCGFILANSLTPFLLWIETCKRQEVGVVIECRAKDFIFSQTLGIYLVSTLVFLSYSTFHRYRKSKMKRSALRPAYVSGILWGFALVSLDIAIGLIGFEKAYPISAVGPVGVAQLWSVFFFREIEGKRNLSLMGLALSMLAVGISMNVISYQ